MLLFLLRRTKEVEVVILAQRRVFSISVNRMRCRVKKNIFNYEAVLLGLFIVFYSSSTVYSSELTLALADSTCTVMQRAGAVFSHETGIKLNYVCKSSGLLAKGIKAGVIPADYFVSANKKWMDEVVKAGFAHPLAVRKGWKNTLVVASGMACKDEFPLQILSDLNNSAVEKIVIGDPGTAPFGRYAKEALVNSGLWSQIKYKIVSRKKISLAIKTLHDSSHPGMVGFLYKTNVKVPLHICFEVPQNFYTAVYYFSCPLLRSQQKIEMERFISFIHGEEASMIFMNAGFGIN